MPWLSCLRKWRARPPAQRWLPLEALVWLGLMRAATLLLPFRWIVAASGLARGTGPAALDGTLADRAGQVGWAVRAAAVRTPWASTCLSQALAGTMMLARRGIAPTILLGVARDTLPPANLGFHAWLRCGDVTLTGDSGLDRFTVLSTFTIPALAAKP